jgi:Fic family protein
MTIRSIDASGGMLAGVLRKARSWQSLNIRPVNERQRLVINRMLGEWQGFLTTSKYATLAKCSADTAQRDIKELLGWGAVVQNEAGGRSTSYRLRDSSEGARDRRSS